MKKSKPKLTPVARKLIDAFGKASIAVQIFKGSTHQVQIKVLEDFVAAEDALKNYVLRLQKTRATHLLKAKQ